ncbi:hypothetical protein ATJ97_0015 [Georgenia soli]|uniref:Uncharacterized protein n=1 Tax=Georgenia soli TaxID=638953 RepID=A0A2A9F124_9MICO|nr:hypothetical protein [Georgenia soli]PFG45097.1 hypothetical protein ATJ97_0015 [Georgenia soli]
MSFIGNPGPLPGPEVLKLYQQPETNIRGSGSRTVAFFASVVACGMSLIAWFSDPDTFHIFAIGGSALATFAGLVAIVRSPQGFRWPAYIWTALGLAPAVFFLAMHF